MTTIFLPSSASTPSVELVEVHETAFAELGELLAQRQGVEVVGHEVDAPGAIDQANTTE